MPRGRPKAFDTNEALRAALQVFWAKGFDATSIGDLTEATGLGRQSLYNEFGDKERLFEAAVKNYRVCETAHMISLLKGPGSAKERIQSFFNTAIKAHFDGQRRGCFLSTSIAIRSEMDANLSQLLDDAVNDLRNAFIACLEEGVQSGELSDQLDPKALGYLFFTLAQGLSIVGKCQKDRTEIERSVKELLSLLP